MHETPRTVVISPRLVEILALSIEGPSVSLEVKDWGNFLLLANDYSQSHAPGAPLIFYIEFPAGRLYLSLAAALDCYLTFKEGRVPPTKVKVGKKTKRGIEKL